MTAGEMIPASEELRKGGERAASGVPHGCPADSRCMRVLRPHGVRTRSFGLFAGNYLGARRIIGI